MDFSKLGPRLWTGLRKCLLFPFCVPVPDLNAVVLSTSVPSPLITRLIMRSALRNKVESQ